MVDHIKEFEPFSEGPAKNIKTGVLLDDHVVKDMLTSTTIGEKILQEFIEKRINNSNSERTDFFHPIKNPKLNTGLNKVIKEPKNINILKEDKQAFGLLLGKSTSPKEAHSYHLTSVPLSLAAPDGNLR